MKFGTSKAEIQDSGNASYLSMPYLGEARLTSVVVEDIESKSGDLFPDVLKFQFKVLGEDVVGNDVKGQIVEKAEFPPREDDDQKKITNKTGRIGYIMKYFMPEEDVLINNANSWREFVDIVIKRFEKNSGYVDIPVKLKVVGNVYNGKANVQIPNYKGFLQGESSDSAITFSKNELSANREYIQVQTVPDDNVEVVESDPDDLF